MRKLLLVLAVVIACALGFSLWKLRTVVSRSVTEFAEAVARESNADVETGEVALTLFPPAVEVLDVKVSATAGDGEKFRIFAAPRVRVTPQIMSVFVGKVVVSEVVAIAPTLLVRRLSRDGRRVWSLPIEDEGDLEPLAFPVSLRDATLRVEDRTLPAASTREFDRIDLCLRPPLADGSWPFEVSAPLFGDRSAVAASGSVAPGVGPTGGSRLDVEFQVRSAAPEDFAGVFGMLEGVPLTGELDFEGSARGMYGERGDENVPAVPLGLDVRGSSGFVFAGREDRLAFDIRARLDDKILRIDEGRVRWGDVPLGLTGYVGTRTNHKLAIRLIATEADVAETLDSVGVPERWHARATLDGTLRITGTLTEPLLRYEATIPSVELDAFRLIPVRGKDLSCRGSVLAINAELSASCKGSELRLAAAVLPNVNFGITYWRDQIRFTQQDLEVWDGKGTLMAAWETQNRSLEGGGFLDDMDAALAAKNLIPDTGLDIAGRLDSIYQLGFDARGLWSLGRIGLHRGRLGGLGLVREAVAAVVNARSEQPDVMAALTSKHPKTLAEGAVEFRRLAFDYESREEGVALRTVSVEMADAEFRGEGVVGYDDSVALWGNVLLGESLTEDLVARVAGARPLVAADGRLRISVRIQGSIKAFVAAVDERFMEALAAASRGADVGPFVPMEPDAEIVSDLPRLREHFYR